MKSTLVANNGGRKKVLCCVINTMTKGNLWRSGFMSSYSFKGSKGKNSLPMAYSLCVLYIPRLPAQVQHHPQCPSHITTKKENALQT